MSFATTRGHAVLKAAQPFSFISTTTLEICMPQRLHVLNERFESSSREGKEIVQLFSLADG